MGLDHRIERNRFSEQLERHMGIVRKVSAAYSRTSDDRHDLAQEICLQLWKAYPSYDEQRRFSTWMYRIALNVAISSLRSNAGSHRQTSSLDEETIETTVDAANAGENDERIELLQRFIASLDPLNRALILLYLDEHSYREIADILGISETNVATKISRLKHRVRQDTAHQD